MTAFFCVLLLRPLCVAVTSGVCCCSGMLRLFTTVRRGGDGNRCVLSVSLCWSFLCWYDSPLFRFVCPFCQYSHSCIFCEPFVLILLGPHHCRACNGRFSDLSCDKVYQMQAHDTGCGAIPQSKPIRIFELCIEQCMEAPPSFVTRFAEVYFLRLEESVPTLCLDCVCCRVVVCGHPSHLYHPSLCPHTHHPDSSAVRAF